MVERVISPPLADIVEAIERIRHVLTGVTLDAFEADWEKRWLLERGVEVISEASRRLTGDLKERQAHIPSGKVAGIGNVLRHDYDHVAPDILLETGASRSAGGRSGVPHGTGRCGTARRPVRAGVYLRPPQGRQTTRGFGAFEAAVKIALDPKTIKHALEQGELVEVLR